MPKHTASMSGEAFTNAPDATPRPEVDGFDLRAWIAGTAPVTRSVTVYGRPDLQGEIEALRDDLAETDDPADALTIARTLEAKRAEMTGSALRFRFRGLRNGELEELRAATAATADADGVTELDYRILERQCVAPAGVTWGDFATLHTTLGAYFMRTIMRTASEAVTGGGVDVPFSSASSALIKDSGKS